METCEFDKLFVIRVLHIHEKIFFSLDYNSFKNCQKVCKSWHNMLTSESSLRWRKSVFREAIQEELISAIFNGQTEVVRETLSNEMIEVDFLIQDKSRLWLYTPLWLAAAMRNEDIVQLLLDAGAEPDKLDTNHKAPAIWVASTIGHLGLIKALLGGGANPNIMESKCRTTALHVASNNGYVDVAKLLLNAGSDPNLRDFDGRTPLSYALTEVNIQKGEERKERKKEIANILRQNGGTQ